MSGLDATDDGHPVRRWLVRLFVPRIDELAVFLMGLATLLIFATDPTMRAELARLFHGRPRSNAGLVVAAFFVLFGIGVALYNVFVIHSADRWEKLLMVLAAVVISAGSSIAAGAYLWHRGSWVEMVLPAWNMLNGVVLLVLYRIKVVNEETFDDSDATRLSLALGTVLCVGGWALCRWVVHLHWALTLSTAVFYATNGQALVTRFVESRRAKGGRPT